MTLRRKLLLTASAFIFSFSFAAVHAPILAKERAAIMRAVKKLTATFPFPVTVPSLSSATASGTLTFRTTRSSTGPSSPQSFAGLDIGAANANRTVFLGVIYNRSAGTVAITGVTADGSAMSKVNERNNGSGFGGNLWAIAKPSGTTCTFAVTYSGTIASLSIGVYTSDLASLRVYNIDGKSTSNPVTGSIVSTDCGSIYVLPQISTTTHTFTYSGTDTPVEDYANNIAINEYHHFVSVISTENASPTWTYSAGSSVQHFISDFTTVSGSPYTPVLADSMTDGTDQTTFTFTSRNIGTANAARMVVIAFGWENSTTRSVSSVTVGGNGATLANSQTSTTGGAAIYHIAVASGTTATIVITFSGTVTRLGVAVYDTRPLHSNTHKGTAKNTATSTTVTCTDCFVLKDGFMIIAGSVASNSDTNSSTYNGVDTPTKDVELTIETARMPFWSFIATEGTTMNDPGFSGASSVARRICAASWL